VFKIATTNKWLFFQGGLVALVAILVIVLIWETAAMTRSLYVRASKAHLPVWYGQREDPHAGISAAMARGCTCLSAGLLRIVGSSEEGADRNSAASKTLGDIVADERDMRRFRSTADALSVAAATDAALPNLLVRGVSGTGKSAAASAIAHDSGLRYCILNSAELLGLGEHASLYLFDFLRKVQAANEPMVVILDGADDIIMCRGDAPDSAGFTESCFYVLLQQLRLTSNRLSMIMTCELHHCEVDTALLDRVDSLLSLHLPAVAQRIEYGLRRSLVLFRPYLSGKQCSDIASYLDKTLSSGRDGHGSISSSGECGSSSSEGGNANSQDIASASPETDTPPRVQFENPKESETVLLRIDKVDADFNCHYCVTHLASSSAGWSFRDMDKVLGGVVSSVLGTERCQVTSRLFLQEVKNTVNDKMTDVTPTPRG